MLRLFAFGRRKAALTRLNYHDALLNRHAPLVKACEAFQRYCAHYHQNHVAGLVANDALSGLRTEQAPFDNCSEFWFDHRDSLLKTFTHPSYLQTVRPDEPNWTDGSTRVVFLAEETEIPTAEAARVGSAATKLLALVQRHSRNRNIADFLLPRLPGCMRHTENRILGQLDLQKGKVAETGEVPFVHLSELWFESPRELQGWLAAGGAVALLGSSSAEPQSESIARVTVWASERVIF